MSTKTKRFWLALALVIAFAIAVGLLWKKEPPPQIITLPHGEQYQFVTAEWGTNQVQPTFAARFVARLPTRLANYIMQKYGSRLGIVTPVVSRFSLPLGTAGIPFALPPPEPALHFWFRSLSTNTTLGPLYANLKFMLADQDGVVAGRDSSGWRGYSYGNDMWETFGQGTNRWLTFTLPVVPRRSETLQLQLFQAEEVIGTVRFRNPLFGRFPSWQPEPLPATKTSGDLQVRLTDFSVGVADLGHKLATVNGAQTHFRPPRPGEAPNVVFKVDLTSPRGTNETWLVIHAELSDATGNRVRSDHPSRFRVTGEYNFGPVLWPDEAAWRLKLTLQRSCGLVPEELMTFTNVSVPPIGATNTLFLTNHVQGVPVVLKQEFSRPFGQEARFTAELPEKPDSMAVDFMEWSADTGRKVTGYNMARSELSRATWSGSIPTNVTRLDITWAVQRTRTVEFLVKPPKAE